jgi:MAP/microtubule affinity-regulating kinase
VESEQKEEWDKDVTRKLGSTMVGSKSEMTTSPLVGPERKKSSTIPSVSKYSDMLQFVELICCHNFL